MRIAIDRQAGRTSRVALPLILTLAGVLVIGVGAGAAADPFVAGGPSSRTIGLDRAAATLAIERAAALGRALGLPDGRRSVERLDDRFDHQLYDEVTTTDARGRPVAIQRLGRDGRLVMATSLGWLETAPGVVLGRDEVVIRAASMVRAADISVSGRPDVRSSSGSGGWSVAWPRLVDNVPVRGDGVRVALWADGTFHSLGSTEHPLAAAPLGRLGPSDAARLAGQFLDRYFDGPERGQLTQSLPVLAWIAPNDTFAPARPDAPAETLRLAWTVEVRTTGALADRLTALEIWLDAGSGEILGGDVAQ